MAQTKFNKCSIKLSTAIGDPVLTATANGKTFSAADRLDAINRARQIVYTRMLHEYGMEAMIVAYPEFVRQKTADIFPVKSADIRKVLKIYEPVSAQIVEGVPIQEYFNVTYDTYCKWKLNGSVIRFAEYGSKVELLGVSPS